MVATRSTPRRGVAMLIALAALVLCMTAVVSLTALAASTTLTRDIDHASLVADDLLLAAEDPILHWLEHEAPTIVLPEDSSMPQVPVLHDVWLAHEVEHELRITAWDQLGMVPLSRLRSGSTLRLAIPDHVLRLVDTVEASADLTGLDSFAAALSSSDVNHVFPRAGETTVTVHTDGDPSRRLLPDEDYHALGAFITPHQQGRSQAARININTAPMPLVRAALREAGRGGYDQIAASRAAGKAVNIASLPTNDESQDHQVTVTGTSNLWAFRIDIRVGSVQQSWWCVYEGRPGEDAGGWIQRLVITH